MAEKVTWTERAEEELLEVLTYVAKQSPQNAAIVLEKLDAAATELVDFPRIGPRVPEFGEEDHLRERHILSYRLLYRLTPDDGIFITAVWHAARPLPQSVERR